MKPALSNKSYATFGVIRSLWQTRYTWGERKKADTNMMMLYQSLLEQEERIVQKLGYSVENLRILEIGPGQGMERAKYFGIKNEVIGFDLDVIPQGADIGSYVKMISQNGLGRFSKTVGRKMLIGGRNAAAWSRVVGVTNMRPPRMLHGDICTVVPEGNPYDLVISWSVFEHLPDPRKALEHVIASLHPGGVFYISIHLYTSFNGSHDMRLFTGQGERLPLWGHLIPSESHLFHPSAYLNKWRLAQWRQVFAELAPGCNEYLEARSLDESYRASLNGHLREKLSEYTDEELLSIDAAYLWRKPE